jgi:uncharacterized repeat protein (TIGR01451 family)
LAAGLTLLASGCVILGLGSHSFQVAAKAGGQHYGGEVSEAQFLSYQVPAPTSSLSTTSNGTSLDPGGRSAHGIFAGLPLMFEPNQGQASLDPADPRVRFLARGSGYSLLLGSEGAILRLRSQDSAKQNSSKRGLAGQGYSRPAHLESVEMRLAGANPNASLTGAGLLPGKSNYLLGNDPAKWRQGIPQYARVRYEGVYPGINLIFYGNQGRLEYDFQVAPGADPAQAELEFDSGKQLELKDGALVIHYKGKHRRGEHASVRLEAPRAYQEIAGREQPVEASFVLRGRNRAGFAIGSYDHSRQLVIDPVLSFATYFGGSGDEVATSVAVDGASNIYLAGSTDSPSLPGATGTLSGIQNVYIAKIQPPQGTTPAQLIYVTYLGGEGTDYPVGIAVDGAGDAYVAGTTTSTKFPTTQTAYQTKPENPGNQHVFVTKLNPTAIAPPLYSSYLSGNGIDVATGMTIDAQANIYVTGTTTSVEALLTSTDQFPATQLPQPLPFQNIPRYSTQFFVTKVDTNAVSYGSIAYSTYFGGGAFVAPLSIAGGGIAVDSNHNIYFTGTTNFIYSGTSSTTDFPILNAYQPCLDQPPTTVIVGTPTCSDTTTTSNPDAFAAKLNPNAAQGEQLLWSTYLGGSQNDYGNGIALDPGAANVYVTGTTNSDDFVASTTLATFASFQKCLNNEPVTPASGSVTCPHPATDTNTDAFVARLSNPTNTGGTPTNVSLTYFSYLGGSNNEEGLAIAVDTAAGALLTGWTQSPANFVCANNVCTPQSGTFPVSPYPNPIQNTLYDNQAAYVARINTAAAIGGSQTATWAAYYGGGCVSNPTPPPPCLPEPFDTQGSGITLDTNGNTYVAGDTNSPYLQLREPLSQSQGGDYNGGYDAFVAQLGTAASLSISGVLTLGPNQTYISAGNQATFTYTLINNGPDLAQNVTVTDNLSTYVTEVPLTFVSASATSGTCSGSSSAVATCTIPSLQAGSTATITIVLTPTPTGGLAQFNGGAVKATAANGITTPTIEVPAYMSDYSMSASPTSITIPAAGDSATYQVVLYPNPVYGTAITLSVSGLPTGATSSFTTTSVTLQGTSGATSTMTISTTPRPITTAAASLWTRPFFAIWLAVPGLALLGIGGDRRRRRAAAILLLGLTLALLLLQPACSSRATPPPITGTPPGTYQLTVTATAGSDTKNQSVVLTVP